MADGETDYKVGPGRLPLHTRFKKGYSGNPGGRSPKARAALRATKILYDMMKDVEQNAGVASPPPAPPRFIKGDEQVVDQLVERIRHQVLQEIAGGEIADPRK
jgi:hypothetical protein